MDEVLIISRYSFSSMSIKQVFIKGFNSKENRSPLTPFTGLKFLNRYHTRG